MKGGLFGMPLELIALKDVEQDDVILVSILDICGTLVSILGMCLRCKSFYELSERHSPMD